MRNPDLPGYRAGRHVGPLEVIGKRHAPNVRHTHVRVKHIVRARVWTANPAIGALRYAYPLARMARV